MFCFLFLQNLQLAPQTSLPVQLERLTVSQWHGGVMGSLSVMTRAMRIVVQYALHLSSSVRKDSVLMRTWGVMEKLTAKINLMKWIVIVRFIFLFSWLWHKQLFEILFWCMFMVFSFKWGRTALACKSGRTVYLILLFSPKWTFQVCWLRALIRQSLFW